jgi:hypothetical protein
MLALVPCVACSRHIKSSGASCPFCGAAALARSFPSGPAYPRLAAAAAAAASVATLASCQGSTDTSPPEAGPPEAGLSAAPPYGATPIELECTSAAACLPGQVCCYDGTLISRCQAGPCPVDGGQEQLCAVSAECGPGETCAVPFSPLIEDDLQTCNPLQDGGAESGSPVDAGDAGDGADGGDAPGMADVGAGD